MALLIDADVAKLVDALDLGSSAARRKGSSPFLRTSNNGIGNVLAIVAMVTTAVAIFAVTLIAVTFSVTDFSV